VALAETAWVDGGVVVRDGRVGLRSRHGFRRSSKQSGGSIRSQNSWIHWAMTGWEWLYATLPGSLATGLFASRLRSHSAGICQGRAVLSSFLLEI